MFIPPPLSPTPRGLPVEIGGCAIACRNGFEEAEEYPNGFI
jgi:hypothetical protein